MLVRSVHVAVEQDKPGQFRPDYPGRRRCCLAATPAGRSPRDRGELRLASRWQGPLLMTNTALDPADLGAVHGGMRTDDLPLSENIEDRRDMTLEESQRVEWPQPPPTPPLIRTPGDLPSQLGIDDIGKHR
jgi:hypothetical protein